MSNAKRKLLSNVMLMSMLAGMSDYSLYSEQQHSPTRCKDVSDIPGNYHNGIYSKQKKLRKGAGKKKLTRAQRKKFNGGFKK